MQNYNEENNPTINPDNVFLDVNNEEYLMEVLDKLRALERVNPDKKYALIFYDRYVDNLSISNIAKMYNLSEEEVCARIMEISKAVNKEIKNKKIDLF